MRCARTLIPLAAAMLAGGGSVAAALAGCGGGGGGGGGGRGAATPSNATSLPGPAGGAIRRDPANAKVSLRIGSKNFTEQKILGEIFAQGLAAAGYRTSTRLGLGDERAALAALRAGRVDAYPEYTGTALLSFFGKRASELPKDPARAYAQARTGFARLGLVAFPPTPFTNSNEVAVTMATAQRLHLRTISDLRARAAKLTLYGAPECRRRLDCLVGLEKVYGLRFRRFVAVPIPRRHEVLTSGRADLSIVFTTDPQIVRNHEVLLVDDKGMFPPYNSTLVMRREVADPAGPQLGRVIQELQAPLTDEAMQELDARVDLDRKSPAVVAREYLAETGLVRR
jgi:osmoprotectant transport system substrate-binding protein